MTELGGSARRASSAVESDGDSAREGGTEEDGVERVTTFLFFFLD
jgi:hypothetical protein